jgi:hypothetical protein
VRENAEAKARRYVVEGRLVISDVTGAAITATCRGDAAIYDVAHHPGRGWRCTCAARGRCAHLLAAGFVTAIPTRTTTKKENQQ